MAPRAKSLKCGGCNNIINTKCDKVLCFSCKLSFHIDCAEILENDMTQLNNLGKLSKWKCNSCNPDLEVMKSDELQLQDTSEPMIGEIKDSCCQCFDHIKLLTDQIYELTKNQIEMRNQLSELQLQNVKLTSNLDKQANLTGNILLTTSDNSDNTTYAKVVKSRVNSSLLDVPSSSNGPNTSDQRIGSGPRPSLLVDRSGSIQSRYSKSSTRAIKLNYQIPNTNDTTELNKTITTNSNGPRPTKQPKIGTKRKAKDFITGSAKGKQLCVVEKHKYLFVSRLADSVDCDSLGKYLNDGLTGNYLVTQLKNKYPGYRSFKVGVPSSLWNQVYDPDFWPNGTYVSQFWFRRRSSETENRPNSSFLESHASTLPVT